MWYWERRIIRNKISLRVNPGADTVNTEKSFCGSRFVCSFPLVDLLLVDERVNDNCNCNDKEGDRNGVMQNSTEVAVVQVHKADEVFFAHRPENQGKKNRRERELILVHDPADHAESNADADIEDILVNGEGTRYRREGVIDSAYSYFTVFFRSSTFMRIFRIVRTAWRSSSASSALMADVSISLSPAWIFSR